MADERMVREIEYIVSVHGTAALTSMQAELARVNRELAGATNAVQAGAISVEEYHKKVRELTAAQADLAERVVVTDQVIQNGGKALKDTSQQAAAAGRAFLEFGRAAEDFSTAGFLGVINNLPTMLGNIGTAAGLTATSISLLTGGIALAGAAAYTLYRNWGDLVDALGFGSEDVRTALETLRDRAKELEKIEFKTVFDRTELDQAIQQIENADRAFKAFRESVTRLSEAERESGAAVGRVLGEAPGGREAQAEAARRLGREAYERSDVKARLDARAAEIDAQMAAHRQAVAARGGEDFLLRWAREGMEADRQKIQEERGAALRQFVTGKDSLGERLLGDLIAEAQRGQADAIERLAGVMGGARGGAPSEVLGRIGGPEDIAGQLRAVMPESMREAEREEKDARRLQAERQEREAADREHKARFREQERWLEQRTADDIRNDDEERRLKEQRKREVEREQNQRTADDIRNADLEAKEKDRQAREAAKFERDAPRRQREDISRAAQRQFGIGEESADQIARRTMALMGQGLNQQAAYIRAAMEQDARLRQLEMGQAMLANRFRWFVQRAQARGGHRNPNQ